MSPVFCSGPSTEQIPTCFITIGPENSFCLPVASQFCGKLPLSEHAGLPQNFQRFCLRGPGCGVWRHQHKRSRKKSPHRRHPWLNLLEYINASAGLRECAAGLGADGLVSYRRQQCPLSRSLSGVKRTWVGALHMSACDPKRTLGSFIVRPLPEGCREPCDGRLEPRRATMRRRDFIKVLAGSATAVWPLAVRAEMPVIGYLSGRSPEDLSALLKGLNEAD